MMRMSQPRGAGLVVVWSGGGLVWWWSGLVLVSTDQLAVLSQTLTRGRYMEEHSLSAAVDSKNNNKIRYSQQHQSR